MHYTRSTNSHKKCGRAPLIEFNYATQRHLCVLLEYAQRSRRALELLTAVDYATRCNVRKSEGEDVTVESKAKNSANRKRMIVGVVVIAAVAVAAVFVMLSSQGTQESAAFDYSAIPQERQQDGGFVLGNPDAPVTIVAFEDFLCGHCQRYKSEIDQFITEYVAKGLARFEYRFTPVVNPSYSPLSAKLAECSETLRPGSFWNAHDALFEISSARQFSDNSSRIFAEQMGLSYSDLLECTRDANQVDIDLQLANQLQVTGTPTVFVRYGDAFPRLSPFGNQPTFEQLAMIVDSAS